jgi:hypothetical protein
MSVTRVDRDYDNLAITLIADFDAPIDQVWELWSDPRKLERWLGPPTHPASVQKHDLTRGGEITFPSLSTSGETLTIEESMNLEGENGAPPECWRRARMEPRLMQPPAAKISEP